MMPQVGGWFARAWGFASQRSRFCLWPTSNYSLLRGIDTKFFRLQIIQNLYSRMDKAPGQRSPCPAFEPRTLDFFDFSLFSFFMELPLACESSHEYSTSIFIGRGFVRGGCIFSRNIFSRNMFSRNMFSRNMFSRNMFSRNKN